ncbi:hypothetical protein B7463_g11027, partial [Scytalidium lignicola]
MMAKLCPEHFSLDFAIRPNGLAFPKYVTATSDELQGRPAITLDANENSAGCCLVPDNPLLNGDKGHIVDHNNLNSYPSASQFALRQAIVQFRQLTSKDISKAHGKRNADRSSHCRPRSIRSTTLVSTTATKGLPLKVTSAGNPTGNLIPLTEIQQLLDLKGLVRPRLHTVCMLSKVQMPFKMSSISLDLAYQALTQRHYRERANDLQRTVMTNRTALLTALAQPYFARRGIGRHIGGSDGNFVVIPVFPANCMEPHHQGARQFETALVPAIPLETDGKPEPASSWSAIDAENLVRIIHTINFCSEGKTVAVVRVPGAQSHLLTHALDAGAAGIIFPHIDTAEEAAEAVSKYFVNVVRGHQADLEKTKGLIEEMLKVQNRKLETNGTKANGKSYKNTNGYKR